MGVSSGVPARRRPHARRVRAEHRNRRMTEAAAAAEEVREEDLEWKAYTVDDLDLVTSLIDNELSEPYSIFTYRYFLNQWPQLCILVRSLP